MTCPNNKECDIQFYAEQYDHGDANTPYFSSWVYMLYDPIDSQHVPECPPLTEQQILDLETTRNLDNLYDDPYGEP